ncbi:MAG: hypothetical protein Q4E53_06240 [Eubacteriales bacterium]|nr:hypothetical protein [Eubacteriales bacterium]
MLKNIDQILEDLEEYLSSHYVELETTDCEPEKAEKIKRVENHSDTTKAADGNLDSILSLEEMLESMGESFQEMLFRKIEERGMTYLEVYKRAGIDRRLSSKIRSNPAYHPSKVIVLQLAISLRLSMKETEDLLSTAEYAFSANNKRDIIIQFFIEKGIYDFDTINYCLYEYEQPLLADPKARGV